MIAAVKNVIAFYGENMISLADAAEALVELWKNGRITEADVDRALRECLKLEVQG